VIYALFCISSPHNQRSNPRDDGSRLFNHRLKHKYLAFIPKISNCISKADAKKNGRQTFLWWLPHFGVGRFIAFYRSYRTEAQ
jgi:hypothetical protein